jgi:hypothetical protein
LLIRLGHVRRHQNAEAERMVPISVFFQHRSKFLLGAMGLAAVTAGREKIAVATLGHLGHRRRTARSGYPNRWKRFLQRFRPKIYVAEWKVATFVSKRTVFSPGAHDQIRRLPEFFPRVCGWNVVVESLRAAAGGEAGDQTTVAHLIKHGVFFGHAHWIHV